MADHRAVLTTTVDAALLEAVDNYLKSHHPLDRGAIVDEALLLWAMDRRERDIEAQYDESPSQADSAEHEGWSRIRRAAAVRVFNRT